MAHRRENNLPMAGSPNAVAAYQDRLPHPYMDDLSDEPELDLHSLFRVVLRYRKLILSVFLLVFGAAILSLLIQRPMYTATATLELNTQGRNVVKLNAVQSENMGSHRYVSTQIKVLESRSVAGEVVDRLGLTKEREFNGQLTQRSILGAIRSIPNLLFSDEEPNSENAILATNIYLGRLNVSTVAGSSLVNVSVTSFDPEMAAKLADEHVQAYIQLSSERRFDSSSEAKGFIEKELANIQVRLQDSELKLTKFARENGVIDVEDSNNIMMSRLQALNQSLSEVQNNRIDAETQYLQSNSVSNAQLTAVHDDPLIQSLREEHTRLKVEYLEKSKIFKPKYPVMQQLEAKIGELDASISEQGNKVVTGLKNQFLQLQLRETGLKEEVEALKVELLDLKDRAVTYNILKREWEANKSLYANLLEKTKEIGVASGMELNAGTLVDNALVPFGPSSPRVKFTLLVASALGLGLGFGLAFLLVLLDSKVNDVDALERLSNFPNLVVLPNINLDDVDEDMTDSDIHKSIDWRVITNPNDIFSESIQSLRTTLNFTNIDHGENPKSLVVTSSVAGEGKSTVSTNLALSYAKAGKKVLLIEADLRKPRLAKVFNLNVENGLAHSLNTGEALKPVRIPQFENLHVVLAGERASNPVELLGSASMRTLVRKSEESFDLVIIDCPPILGLADTVAISTMVEAVLLVVCAHKVPSNSVKNSVDRLRMVKAPIVGTIMNRNDTRISGYDYYAYGYYRDLHEQDQLPKAS